MSKILIYLFLLAAPLCAAAQSITQVTHYSVDDGLSENHVLCMLQDRKGVMWFGTHDGLNKFDGYTFRNFKGGANQQYKLSNFRIDRLEEDKQGYFWVLTNDGRIYRFDTSTETFLPVPQCIDGYQDYKSPFNRFNILDDGSVWLRNSALGYDNCFRVENIATGPKIKLTCFPSVGSGSSSTKINKVYLDNNQNTWLLTSGGVDFLKKGDAEPVTLLKAEPGENTISVYEDEAKVYIGGTSGKLREYDKSNRSPVSINTPIEASIIDIHPIGADELLLVTNTSDFYVYRPATKQFRAYKLPNVANNKVYGSYLDRDNNVWIDTDNAGAILFVPKTNTIINLPVENNTYTSSTPSMFHVIEDITGTIWIQLRAGGFFKYNKTLKRLELIPNSKPNDKSLSNLVHTALSDNQGNLWLSTYLQGVDKVVFKHSPFVFTKPIDTPAYNANNEIRSIFQDSKNRIWVGSKKGLVYLYNDNKVLTGHLGSNGTINGNQPFNAAVYNIMEDHTGAIWLGTKGKGLFKLVEQPSGSFSITNYQNNPNDPYSLNSNSVYTLFEDHLHRIWAGTFGGGINLLDTGTGAVRFINNRNELKQYPTENSAKVRFITEDAKHNMLIGTTQGLLVCKADVKSPGEITFQRYSHNPDNAGSLSGNDVQAILPSRKGDIYLALLGGGINVIKGGLNALNEPTFEPLTGNEGTAANAVYTLNEDGKGCVWMSGQTQIIKYEPTASKTDIYKPTSQNTYFFGEGAACATKQGEIIYGTSDGFVSFDPLKINKSVFVPTICLTQLQISNKPVQVGNDGSSPLQATIDDTREVVLTHRQNTFSIEYAALDYTNPHTIKYAYRLDGLESEWNNAANQRIANYVNLPKGKYVFRVRSTNADGEWCDNERTVTIVKQPSFWESAWGLAFYAAAFILLSAISAYILFVIHRLRNEIGIEQRISDMKLRFFTDISHELRTPLTLIAAPIDNLLKKETLSVNAKEQLQVVQRNTNRLLRLVNQILDFRKIQSNKMQLIVEALHVADFMNDICTHFKKTAEEKSIDLRIIDHTRNALLWADKDKFEKIFFNLLSNAFKFTQTGNGIEVVISEDTAADHIIITVRDQGEGISKERLKMLFERFESFATTKATWQASTGIGLSLTKELVELHRAKIDVESEPGKGSAFKVTFKKGFAHFGKNNEFLLHDTAPSVTQPTFETDDATVLANGNDVALPGDRPKILIVEDNRELRGFLHTSLSTNYEVYQAENGMMALEMAQSVYPDMIISDVMMPDMDGLELARTLKDDINLSHIPLVLLTAKTDIESKLEAMEFGVDDYITKPFSLTYLQARIENLLKIRNQLQDYFKASLTSGVITLSKPNVTNLDELFIHKTMKYLEEHYENSEMNIDDIAEDAGVSRSSFFKKVKSLTGLAPVDFVREFRMQKATQLIEAGETNVGQIAYCVGITDARYFSKCFKQKYGVTPSEYMGR